MFICTAIFQREIEELIASKERMMNEYQQTITGVMAQYRSSHQMRQTTNFDDMFKKMKHVLDQNADKFQSEIQNNENAIADLIKIQDDMKVDLDDIKENVLDLSESVTALKYRVTKVEELQEERGAVLVKVEQQMENMLNTTPEILQTQKEIVALCQDPLRKLFYQTISKQISMMFFDAKVVASDYIKHQIPAKTKVAKVNYICCLFVACQ